MTHFLNPPQSPAQVDADARNRGWRTLVQGLLVTAIVAACTTVAAGLSPDIEWTPTYWKVLGVQVGTAVLTAVVSWLARHFLPPAA